jgi:hypothetical protein
MLGDKVVGRIRAIADAFDKRFVEVETNVREIMDPFVDWCGASHGAAMASVGHLLSPAFRRIYFAAPHTYANLFPCGSHPLVDPLWSTEGLEFVHDGCEATRVEKVALVATSDVLLQNLRVCFKNTNGAYNCGKCEKCLRTMINLHINRALDRCSAFDQPLNLRRIARIEVTKVDTMSYVRENLNALESASSNPELQRVLRRILRKPQWWLRCKAKCRSGVRRILERSPTWERRIRCLYEQYGANS